MSDVTGANGADAAEQPEEQAGQISQAEQAEQPQPTKRQIARWQQYLANERAEGAAAVDHTADTAAPAWCITTRRQV